jgi:hypothetical protein
VNKFLTSAALLMFTALLIGSLYIPDNAVMWLANTEVWMNVVRIIIIIALVAALFSNPPRSHAFRKVTGILSIILITIAWQQLNSYSLAVLDALSFMQAAVILGLVALEPGLEQEEQPAQYPMLKYLQRLRNLRA